MRIEHIPVTVKQEVVLPAGLLQRLPRRVALFTTAQFLSQYDLIVAQIEGAGHVVIQVRLPHTRKAGQILGCDVQRLADLTGEKIDATLYVGDGFFHPLALAWKNDLPAFLFNPFSGEEYEASAEEIARIGKRHAAALSAFTMAKTIGVLIPNKPGGQLYLQWALELPARYPEKKFVNLVDYNMSPQGLLDFPFCEAFVNTACPRMAFEDSSSFPRPVVNLEDVSPSFYRKQLLAASDKP